MSVRKGMSRKRGLGTAVLLCILMVSLSSCDGGTSADGPQPGQTGSLPEATPSSVELELVDRSGEDDSGFFMSLFEGHTTVLLNGEERELTVAPFIHNESFYYPLEDVVELLGGGFSQQGDTATIKLFGVTAQYTAGQPEVVINGEPYRNDYRLQGYSGQTDNEDLRPLMVEGKMFIPHDIHPYDSPSFGLNITRAVPEAHMLMLGHPEGSDGRQLGIEDIRLYDAFEELPEEVKAEYEYQGVVATVLEYEVEEYRNFSAQVYVLRVMEGCEDVEQMDGRVAAIRIFRGDDGTDEEAESTIRGLKVGDSPFRAWLLYGNETFTNQFYYKVEDGFIDSIVYYTRYFGGAL